MSNSDYDIVGPGDWAAYTRDPLMTLSAVAPYTGANESPNVAPVMVATARGDGSLSSGST